MRILFFVFVLVAHASFAQNIKSEYSITQIEEKLFFFRLNEQHDSLVYYTAQLKQVVGNQKEALAWVAYYEGLHFDYALNDVEKAFALYQKAETMLNEAAPKSKYVALTKMAIGDIYLFNIGAPSKALEYYLGAQRLFEEIGQSQAYDYAVIMNNIGLTFMESNQPDTAEYYLKKGMQLSIETEGRNKHGHVRGLNNLALLYDNTSRFEEAEALYLEVREIYKNNKSDGGSYVTSTSNLAVLYRQMGLYTEAEQLFLEAKSLRETQANHETASFSRLLNNIAALYVYQHRYPEAERFFIKSLEIRRATLGEKHPGYVETLGNLAAVYHRQKDYKKAEEYYLLSIKSLDKNTQTFSWINTNNNLAQLYYQMGEHQKSIAICQALLAQNTDNKSGKILTQTRNILGNNHIQQKDIEKARAVLTDAIAFNTNCPNCTPPNENWQENLLKNLPSKDDEIEDLLQSLKILTEINTTDKTTTKQICDVAQQIQKVRTQKVNNNQDKSRIIQNNYEWMDIHFTALDLQKDYDKAFQISENNKSILLLQAANQANAHEFGDLPKDLAKQELELAKQQESIQAQLLENRPNSEKDSLRRLLNNINLQERTFKDKIEHDYPKYAQLKYKDKSLQVSEIQSIIDNNTALIEFTLAPKDAYVFYIDKTQVIAQKLPVSTAQIKEKTQALHAALSDYYAISQTPDEAYLKYNQPAYWLYQNLLAPVLQNNDIQKLIIIGDGELSQIPFEPLLTDAPPTNPNYPALPYLLRRYAISYNYSASLWHDNYQAQANTNNGQMIAFAADYTLQLDSTRTKFRLPAQQRLRRLLAPLPAAQQEVKTIQQQLDGNFFFGTDANELNFKQLAPNYNLVHLALHGLLDQQNPILSSLAFSENSDTNQNNFLQAFEISKLRLNANLVVLSACETGYGKIERGNGLASLARAFMYAGSPAVVVSLWAVNDGSTAQIMPLFYEQLASGQPKDVALQKAKIAYIKQSNGRSAHPAFWSAFVQMGDNRPIYVATKNNFFYYYAAGAALLAVSILAILWRKFKNK